MEILKSKKKLLLIIILAIILIGAAYFAYYVSDYYHADSRALAALNSTESYTVFLQPMLQMPHLRHFQLGAHWIT